MTTGGCESSQLSMELEAKERAYEAPISETSYSARHKAVCGSSRIAPCILISIIYNFTSGKGSQCPSHRNGAVE